MATAYSSLFSTGILLANAEYPQSPRSRRRRSSTANGHPHAAAATDRHWIFDTGVFDSARSTSSAKMRRMSSATSPMQIMRASPRHHSIHAGMDIALATELSLKLDMQDSDDALGSLPTTPKSENGMLFNTTPTPSPRAASMRHKRQSSTPTLSAVMVPNVTAAAAGGEVLRTRRYSIASSRSVAA